MADVELVIGGHRYSLSCGDGEEAALVALGRTVDEQVQAARAMTSGLTENRQLLYAALFLADQLAAGAPSPAAQGAATGSATVDEAAIAARIDGLTSRVASLTGKLSALAS